MPSGGGAISSTPAAGGGGAAPAKEEKKEEKEEEKVCIWFCDCRVCVSNKLNRRNPTRIWALDCSTRKHKTVLLLSNIEYIFIFDAKKGKL